MSVAPKVERLHSLDAYRGLVMLFLAASGFGLARAANEPGGEFLEEQGYLFFVTHPEWISRFGLLGVSPWDMIQPAFMFMVGVSMPFSYAKRAARGESYGYRLWHAWSRSLLLILLGVFLASAWADQTNWVFTNVLAQIGLGYGFLFFLLNRGLVIQELVGFFVLIGTIVAFILYNPDAPWVMNANVFSAFDQWFLNLWPRGEPFEFNRGGYTTLNFIPAFVTMLLGLSCGELLRRDDVSPFQKFGRLVLGGAVCLTLGVALGETICPVIKRIWTPSWVFFSAGYTIWTLALFYLIVDIAKLKPAFFPLIVIGVNPLTMYFMGQLIRPWTARQLKIHLPDIWFAGWQGEIILSVSVLFVFWLILLYMFRNRIFVRV